MLEENIVKSKTSIIVTPVPTVHPTSLWKSTIFFSLIFYIFVCLYYYLYRGTFSISAANRAFGDVAIIIIGLSFILSSICYFWNFADRYIVYRKQLGVVGFSYTIIHTLIIILYLDPVITNFTDYLQQPAFLSYSLALAAIIMFAGMILISTRSIVHKIGGKLWRELLRAGYIAYIFSLIHFILLGYPFWLRWFTEQKTILPPFGLLTALFGILVILMRLFLMIHKITHGQKNPQPL